MYDVWAYSTGGTHCEGRKSLKIARGEGVAEVAVAAGGALPPVDNVLAAISEQLPFFLKLAGVVLIVREGKA